MDAKIVLKGALWLLLTLLCLGRVGIAFAQGDEGDDGLKRPERITVGVNDQFLGSVAPDRKTLYFVSNRDTRKEIYSQEIEEGRAHLVFDEGADVTWPRVSPDGKSLLYISFREQVTGELCVRSLPDGEHRRCLGDAPAALQAEWLDAERIVLVGRTSIRGDLRVSEVSVGQSGLTQHTLFDRNWTTPAVSPGGRWLVFVPLDRMTSRVGPGYAARTAHRLEAVRLDGRSEPQPLTVDLPGLTGQPAFSRDGRYLYFVQFFSDSNRDGVIDANDHGVLFRIPFEPNAPDAASRAGAAFPEQLTDSNLNCQYPAPAQDRLFATCTRAQTLDIYELPLDGEVPHDWTADHVRAEAELGTRRAQQLLLYRHLLARQSGLTERRLTALRLVMLHLELEEFESAEFYAQKVHALRDAATRGVSLPVLVLVAHRRARNSRERARSIDSFEEESRAQLEQLSGGPNDSPAARVLYHVVRSEIADSLGDKLKARAELEAAAAVEATMPDVLLEAYYARADALYRELDDRDALYALCKQLANKAELPANERLGFARAATRALVRGLPVAEAERTIARERAATAEDSELAFALDLASAVQGIRGERNGRALRERLLALYTAQKQLERKRAIVLDVVQRAAQAGADGLIEALAERYVDDVTPGTQERRRAERLYLRAILGRAYRRLARGRLLDARIDFDAVFRRTESFDAAVGAIDVRLRQQETPEQIEEELGHAGKHSLPFEHFVKAYLLARRVPELHGDEREQAVSQARELLRESWSELKDRAPVRTLYGSLMFQQFLETGAHSAAEVANAHYLVALELVQRDPRARAQVLGQLGLLHAEVGNYRIALGYLRDRERLPFNDDEEALAVKLATARCLLHVDREADSATSADAALALVERAPALAEYRVAVLDRAALSNLSADRFERALALYDAEIPLIERQSGDSARRNRFVVRLARAAAAVGAGQPRRAIGDLDAIVPSLADPALASELASEHLTAEQAVRAYRTIAEGLRANAQSALNDLVAAGSALERRRALFAERLTSSDRDEDVHALALVETRLAENAGARRDFAAAAKWIALALDHADDLAHRTKVDIDADQLRVLWFAATLRALDGARLKFDLSARLRDAQKQLLKRDDPAYRMYGRWFEVYRAMIDAPGR